MVPEDSSYPIPNGWTLEYEVLRDGSKCWYYYCQGTGQQFYDYADLMHYVEYAMEAKVGIYSPNCKSCKRSKKEAEDSVATKSRKISVLSLSSKPSSSSKAKPSTVDQSMVSQSPERESRDREVDPDYIPVSESSVKADQSPSESEHSGREVDPDYMPASESSVQADSQPSETELEVGQVPTAELKDLESDGHTSN